ncbi:MAG: PH domain-containing protein [Rhodothermales bacterium]
MIISAMIFEAYNYFARAHFALPGGVLTGILLVIGIVITITIPRLRYKYWRFDLRTEELYLERGILNRVRTIVPLRRIQHLDVTQNILEREFNLSKLIVHTAGSRSGDVVLPGLRFEEAEQLRDDVKRYILEDAV